MVYSQSFKVFGLTLKPLVCSEQIIYLLKYILIVISKNSQVKMGSKLQSVKSQKLAFVLAVLSLADFKQPGDCSDHLEMENSVALQVSLARAMLSSVPLPCRVCAAEVSTQWIFI